MGNQTLTVDMITDFLKAHLNFEKAAAIGILLSLMQSGVLKLKWAPRFRGPKLVAPSPHYGACQTLGGKP